jgi:DNA invertase Pin-like site-specific DNA recombinase
MTESNERFIGYARVSTLEQNLDLQMDALIIVMTTTSAK